MQLVINFKSMIKRVIFLGLALLAVNNEVKAWNWPAFNAPSLDKIDSIITQNPKTSLFVAAFASVSVASIWWRVLNQALEEENKELKSTLGVRSFLEKKREIQALNHKIQTQEKTIADMQLKQKATAESLAEITKKHEELLKFYYGHHQSKGRA